MFQESGIYDWISVFGTSFLVFDEDYTCNHTPCVAAQFAKAYVLHHFRSTCGFDVPAPLARLGRPTSKVDGLGDATISNFGKVKSRILPAFPPLSGRVSGGGGEKGAEI